MKDQIRFDDERDVLLAKKAEAARAVSVATKRAERDVSDKNCEALRASLKVQHQILVDLGERREKRR